MDLFDNRYLFLKDLGSGGFGKVFLAKEENSDRLVSIKQLKDLDKAKQKSLIHEIQTIAKFNHPNIVTYYHHFIQDETLYLVMEYCSGGSLYDKIKKNELILSYQVLDWVTLLANTLHVVHKKGIIHHDIKPENILFTDDGIIKISDFGVANTGVGTRAYMSPEALNWGKESINDPRVDIYALGVVLMELLINRNPFSNLSKEKIIELHDKSEFPINRLPYWLQEIVLKAIDKIPELRFQTMKEVSEAILAKQVPIIFDEGAIKAGKVAERAEILLNDKKWSRAILILNHAKKHYAPCVRILKLTGKYFLLQQETGLAKAYFDRALKLNPRIDVQKELGWVNLILKRYPTAISLLSDHLHLYTSDFEAYNLLIQCFYETNRYEAAMDLAAILLDVDAKNVCFANNYFISCAMHNMGKTLCPETYQKIEKASSPFLDYNTSVINEKNLSHNYDKKPTLKSKLLFMDYRFISYTPNTLYFIESNIPGGMIDHSSKGIITIGRDYFGANEVEITGSDSVSRRHCIIINYLNDTWIRDLQSTGTFVDYQKLTGKMPLIGKHTIQIDQSEFVVTNDKSLLF